jgi:hypothetical protein
MVALRSAGVEARPTRLEQHVSETERFDTRLSLSNEGVITTLPRTGLAIGLPSNLDARGTLGDFAGEALSDVGADRLISATATVLKRAVPGSRYGRWNLL